MYSLSCKAMGAADCDYVAQGETAEEVKSKMMDHARAKHFEVVSDMGEEKLMAKMDEKMEEA